MTPIVSRVFPPIHRKNGEWMGHPARLRACGVDREFHTTAGREASAT